MNLNSTIKSIQDIMRKDDGVDGDAQRIGQLAWMLFLKIFDQREEEWEDDAKDIDETYKSPLPENCRWRNWAAYKNGKPQIQASELIEHVNTKIFPALKNINIEGSAKNPFVAKAKVVREVFADSNNYMKSGTLMLGVIEKLDKAINFHDFKIRQNLGDIYEKVLNDLRSAGNAGEFYTPRAITFFMVHMVNPRLDKREIILDPACGTGGFLTASIEFLNGQINEKSSIEDKKAIQVSIKGFEKKQLPHLLCATNMLLHGIDIPSQIEHCNTLAKGWNDWSLDEQVDCVITNPPFGGMEDDGVGADYPADIRTRETADMFLVLIIKKLLKNGGRGAVILPDGTLFGGGVKAKIKKLLLEECNLHTIIRLPKGVFNPYTSIKTNLLFFTKGKATENIWFYEHPYPHGYKSYSKTKPIRLEEFDAEKAWWGKEENDFFDRVENEFAWKIDFKARKEEAKSKAKSLWDEAEKLNNKVLSIESKIKELRNSAKDDEIDQLLQKADKLKLQAQNKQFAGDKLYWSIFNLDVKNPNSPQEEALDPDELLIKYKKLLLDIEETQNLLKDELSSTLAHYFEEGENS